VKTAYRAVVGAALIQPGCETRPLVPTCTGRPADTLANVNGLDADHPDLLHHAIDVNVRNTVGEQKLSLVRTAIALPGAGAASFEEAKRKEILKSAALRPRQVGHLAPPFTRWALT
jgi:hypothetical protein